MNYGDRVFVKSIFGVRDDNKIGTVKDVIRHSEQLGVEFDEPIGTNETLFGRGKIGHCWYIYTPQAEKFK